MVKSKRGKEKGKTGDPLYRGDLETLSGQAVRVTPGPVNTTIKENAQRKFMNHRSCVYYLVDVGLAL